MNIKKPYGYWTKEKCFLEAQKYENKIDFQKYSSRAYYLCYKNNCDYRLLKDSNIS